LKKTFSFSLDEDPVIFIQHILTCIDSILFYTKEMDEKSFVQNRLVQDAVVRNFEVIGETEKKVDESFRQKYPSVPWRKMARLRDKLSMIIYALIYWLFGPL
jgi:uncharacterized protein with HEPN domain